MEMETRQEHSLFLMRITSYRNEQLTTKLKIRLQGGKSRRQNEIYRNLTDMLVVP